MKILIVDDSKAMRMIVMRTLRQAGIDATVTEAEDGQDGLEKARAGSYDLILSDWNMPRMLGIEFLQALRADGDRTRFGFVTSESNPDMSQMAVDAGASFMISKPFNATSFELALAGRS